MTPGDSDVVFNGSFNRTFMELKFEEDTEERITESFNRTFMELK